MILFLAHLSLAGPMTLMNVIIEAGPLFADIPRQASVAGTDVIQLLYQFNHILHRACAGIWPEIFRLVLAHAPGKQHSGKGFVNRHLDKRITFIILQHGIVFRPVFLDQIALQHQRFQFRICHNIFEPGDLSDHALNLHTFVPAGLKILTYPVLQTDRLSHINNCVFRVMHDIDSGTCRQFFQFFLYIKRHILLHSAISDGSANSFHRKKLQNH